MNKTIIKERPINNVFNWRNNNYLVEKDEPLEENCNKCAFKIACYNTFVKTCYNTNRCSRRADCICARLECIISGKSLQSERKLYLCRKQYDRR